MDIAATKRARFLNDRLRTTMNPEYGSITLSRSVRRRPCRLQAAVLLAIMDYEFPPLPDYPWFVDMHERGMVRVGGEFYYFGFRYLDPDSGREVDAPADERLLRRLHIMCTEDVEEQA
jgi:hypothetical protein